MENQAGSTWSNERRRKEYKSRKICWSREYKSRKIIFKSWLWTYAIARWRIMQRTTTNNVQGLGVQQNNLPVDNYKAPHSGIAQRAVIAVLWCVLPWTQGSGVPKRGLHVVRGREARIKYKAWQPPQGKSGNKEPGNGPWKPTCPSYPNCGVSRRQENNLDGKYNNEEENACR